MAAYDQGGGCACGISRICDCAHAEKPKLTDEETMFFNRLDSRDKIVLQWMSLSDRAKSDAVQKMLNYGILYLGPRLEIKIKDQFKDRL